MIDIHSHIIPAVDDGSDSMSTTISLISRASGQGATAFFATSHSEAFWEQADAVFQKFAAMKTQLQTQFPRVKVYLGCEVLCSKKKMAEILSRLCNGQLPTMNHTDYVLTEFDQWEHWDTMEFCVTALRNQNFIPIIAHTERYRALANRMDLIDRLRQMGCLIQINVYSLESFQPEDRTKWSKQLIMDQKVDFLGTDMHGYLVRMPSITEGMRWLKQNCDPEYLERISRKNAEDLLIREEPSSEG